MSEIVVESKTVFEDAVQNAIRQLKNDGSITIQGRNPKIEYYYNVWRGKPEWLPYNVHLPDGSIHVDHLKTMNLPRYIARTWANNYANENTEISIPGDEPNKRLQKIFTENNLFGRFNNFVESFMGLGIAGIVVTLDKYTKTTEKDETTGKETDKLVAGDSKIKILTVGGRRVIPITVDDGEFTECAFVSYYTGGAKVTIHWLDDKGEYEITELKAEGKNGSYTFKYHEMQTINTHSPDPLFTCWHPNLTDEDDVDNIVGTSIFDKSMDAFFQTDVCYTALFKEIKLGQKVKMISADLGMTDENGNRTIPYDANDESIIELPAGTDTAAIMQEFNGNLRTPQLREALTLHSNAAAMLCGLGQSVFEFGEGGGRPLQTATAVVVKQNELYKNIIKQENFATDQFKRLVRAIVFMNNTYTNNEKIEIGDLNDVQVKYDDNIMQDTESKKQAELNEVNAGVLSPEEYRSHWFDEDEETALKYLQEHGMLIDKYSQALSTGAITEEWYCKRVFGDESMAEALKEKNQPEQVDDPLAAFTKSNNNEKEEGKEETKTPEDEKTKEESTENEPPKASD